MRFKELHSLERRKAESARIKERFPGRIPVIVEKAPRADIPDIDKQKFLVPADLTVGQFVYVVRRRLSLAPEKSLFMFVGNTLPATSQTMGALYQAWKDEDAFLYLQVSSEHTFG